jgi:hypothetical protein
MSDTRNALIEAVRDHDAACYRDLPPTSNRRWHAEVAVREVLEVVMRNLGLRDGTTVTLRPGNTPLVEEPHA